MSAKLDAAQRAVKAALVGKTIARVEMNAWHTGAEVQTDPVLWFTDGTCLRFSVTEDTAQAADYGVDLCYPGRGSKAKPRAKAKGHEPALLAGAVGRAMAKKWKVQP